MLNPIDFEQCVSVALADCVNQARSNCSVIQSGLECQLVVTFQDDVRPRTGHRPQPDVLSKTNADVGFGLFEIEAFASNV